MTKTSESKSLALPQPAAVPGGGLSWLHEGLAPRRTRAVGGFDMSSVARTAGLGGTDIAAVVGAHPQKDAFCVYAEKTGLIDAVLNETNRRAMWGTKLQRVIAEAWSEITTRPHKWIDQTLQGQAADFQIYTPDGRSLAPGDFRGLEVKTAGRDQAQYWGPSGTAIVPDHYFIQCCWYMSSADLPLWDIAVLIAGADFRIYTLHRDRELETMLLEAAAEFWHNHVLARRPPAPGSGAASAEALKHLFPKNTESIRVATDQEACLMENLRTARERFDAAEATKKELEHALELAIGEADGLTYAGGKVTWKKDRDSVGTNWERIARIACPNEDRLAELMAENQIVTRVGPRKLRCSF
jgi:predicted phage-related endonuclease